MKKEQDIVFNGKTAKLFMVRYSIRGSGYNIEFPSNIGEYSRIEIRTASNDSNLQIKYFNKESVMDMLDVDAKEYILKREKIIPMNSINEIEVEYS